MENTKMAKVLNIKTSNHGYELYAELMNFPVGFVNALRRILITGIPRVVIRDVQILQNTSQIPHEMLRHRTERLPVNVPPSDSATIKDAKIELRIVTNKEARTVTTDDFTVEAGREGLMMRDRDFDTPSLFLKLRAGEVVHVTGRLALDAENASHVCTASIKWHPDPERMKNDRKVHVEAGGDPRLFDNFLYQRSFSRDNNDRPNWFELTIESVGVLKSRELLTMTVAILRKRLDTYMAEALKNIKHENDPGTYSVSIEQGGHTLGVLLQEVIYKDEDIDFVSYDIPHPLKNMMVIRFNTKKTPESILIKARKTIEEYCLLVENNDG
jgi:DNA-directed RNA polymerase subunit L